MLDRQVGRQKTGGVNGCRHCAGESPAGLLSQHYCAIISLPPPADSMCLDCCLPSPNNSPLIFSFIINAPSPQLQLN